MKRCVIISASPNANIEHIKACIQDTDFVMCADAGYITAEKAGIKPDLIAGDFDSADIPLMENTEIIKLPKQKDDTDTFFCVKEAILRGYKDFILLASTGGRLDHTLANLCVLQYISQNGGTGVISDIENDIFYVAEGEEIAFECKKGKTLSIFPHGCESCIVTHHGFEYELENQPITSSFPLGISNVVTDNKAYVTFHKGDAIIIVDV